MPYTTQGFMAPEDLADHQQLTDTGRHPECTGHDDEDIMIPVFCTSAQDCPDASHPLDYEEMSE